MELTKEASGEGEMMSEFAVVEKAVELRSTGQTLGLQSGQAGRLSAHEQFSETETTRESRAPISLSLYIAIRYTIKITLDRCTIQSAG